MNTILTNSDTETISTIIDQLAIKADHIKIGTAFFSDPEFIRKWVSKSKKVDLLVSLRAPTNYYSLEEVYSKSAISMRFLGSNFHSKIYIFYSLGYPFACIVGSSNFTGGGLYKNIETNSVIFDTNEVKNAALEFEKLWDLSYLLQPTDLIAFKTVYDNFLKRDKITKEEQKELENKILTKRAVKPQKVKIAEFAQRYNDYWKIVNEVRSIVHEISEKEYPNIPVYLTIDHFWHWVKVVWSKQNKPTPTDRNRRELIQQLFKDYCYWDKHTANFTAEMYRRYKEVFSKLSLKNIDNLSIADASLIYKSLHSGESNSVRFGANKKFSEDNSIEKIKSSLKYLLYAKDDVDLRIHNLCKNEEYRLKQLSSSGVQEMLGWVMPETYPLRNGKADDAVRLLGYDLP